MLCIAQRTRRAYPSSSIDSNMKARHTSKQFRTRLALFLVLLSILLTVIYEVDIIQLSSRSLSGPLISAVTSTWTREQCHLLAMIPVSPAEIQAGTIRTWYSTISSNLSTIVCCVAVIRSERPHAQLVRNNDSCDTLHVPMVRPDDYLSLSEKVKLGITHALSYYDFNWVLKTDSDSFVCFTRVLRLLSNFDPAGIVHVGRSESTNFLKPDPTHKWYDPGLTDVLHNPRQHIEKGSVMHPPYMQGAGYVVSRGALKALNKVNKLLRYSPIEDIMIGGWLIAFATHRASMGLDLWAYRPHCYLQPFDYISHKRKGKNKLEECTRNNHRCHEVSEGDDVDVRQVAFLIEVDFSNKTRAFIDVYESIRAAFPNNEVIIGDTSSSDSAMKRFMFARSDDNVKVLWLRETARSVVLNELVSNTVSPFLCVLSVEQKMSWETMIARMLRPVWNDEADVTSGFLVFNHNRLHSDQGLFPNGHTIAQNNSEVAFEQVETSWNIWAERQRTVSGTSGFLLARTQFLKETGWRDYGPFSEAEFSLRLWRANARVKLVNSGIRHGYHYAVDPPSEREEEVKRYAGPFCEQVAQLLKVKQVKSVAVSSATVHCSERWFRRKYSKYRWRFLNSFVQW